MPPLMPPDWFLRGMGDGKFLLLCTNYPLAQAHVIFGRVRPKQICWC
ncbi:hypothetical protein PROVRUST_05914 [Providencia rustigianii DSM 4541]|uniref:Uncharacterized protein n=1 Tax=Providencia rustigianii DSM 4541 TaxID=500637 RepID=D1P196_9GAMM|nr:hypothetical protein PROVRUST_05914 [Providencia rustigianii DSM 4541]